MINKRMDILKKKFIGVAKEMCYDLTDIDKGQVLNNGGVFGKA